MSLKKAVNTDKAEEGAVIKDNNKTGTCWHWWEKVVDRGRRVV